MKADKLFKVLFSIVITIIAVAVIYNSCIGAENATYGLLISLLSVTIVLYSLFEAHTKQNDIKIILKKLDEIKLILENKEP